MSLSKYALALRNADPQMWDAFLETFQAYTQEVLEKTADAPADEVLRMQGRAKQCQALLRIFKECGSQPR